MRRDSYVLEMPGGSVDIWAENDVDAQKQAKEVCIKNKINFRTLNLKLFRYSKEHVNRSVGLIEIPWVIR